MPSKGLVRASYAVSILVSLVFLMSAAMKFREGRNWPRAWRTSAYRCHSRCPSACSR